MNSKSKRQTGLVGWLTQASYPIFLLDHRRRVRFFNQAAEKFFSCSTGEVIGRVCSYTSYEKDNPPDHEVLRKIAPPPEIFSKRSLLHSLYFPPQADTQILFLNLQIEEENTTILGFVLNPECITETFNEISNFAKPGFHQLLENELDHAFQQVVHTHRMNWKAVPLIAVCSEMKLAMRQWSVALKSDASVFIYGLPGTGKSTWLQSLHYQSDWGENELVTLKESDFELEQLKQTLLLMTRKHDGTSQAGGIFFRHVEKLPRDSQLFLSEFIQDHLKNSSLRIYASSIYSPEELSKQNLFNHELIMQLTTICVHLPQLKLRSGDLELLSQYFIERCNKNSEHQSSGLSAEVLQSFRQYDWPGNIRELQGIISESHNSSKTSHIEMQDLPLRYRMGWKTQSLGPGLYQQESFKLEELLEKHEREWILWALDITSDNKAAAAQLLGMTRPRFYRRLEALGLLTQNEPEIPSDENLQ